MFETLISILGDHWATQVVAYLVVGFFLASLSAFTGYLACRISKDYSIGLLGCTLLGFLGMVSSNYVLSYFLSGVSLNPLLALAIYFASQVGVSVLYLNLYRRLADR